MEQTSVAKESARRLGNLKYILVLIVILFLFVGLYSQTQVTLRELRARDFKQASSEFFYSNVGYTLTLTYPKFLLLESPKNSRTPMTLQLFPILPLSAPISSSVTSTQPLFSVTLSSTSEAIKFTDEKGVPLAPRVVLTPTLSTIAVIYLHQSTSEARPPTVQITLHVNDERGNQITLAPALNLEIALESGEDLFMARLCELLGTTSIFISLVTGLLGVGWKWWEQEQQARKERERERKEQEDKERKRQEQERQEQERKRHAIETTLGKVESLRALLQGNLSEAARGYLEYTQKNDFPWQESEVRNRLQAIWTLDAPQALQSLITLQRAFPERWTETLGQIGNETAIQSLVWAWRMLDPDWQKRIRPMLTGTVEKEIEARSWQAILKPWRHVCFWKSGCFRLSLEVVKALELLELQRSPFGSERAEADELLFDTWVDWEWSLDTPQPQIIVGKHGAGKTAIAFHTIRNSIKDKTAFPIYVPDFPNQATRHAQLDNLARAMARTVLHFMAFYPRSFLEQDVTGRSAIAQLLGVYIGVGKDLALQLQKAGLDSVAEGRRVFQELERLLSNTLLAPPPDDELIALLAAARPSRFSYTILLVDLPNVSEETAISTMSDTARALLDLSSVFRGEPLYLKILLPDELNAFALNNDVIRLVWSEERLHMLLHNHLGIAGVESLNVWCDPEAAKYYPDQHLIQAAQGSPGQLISLGNKLLARLVSHPDYPKITAPDLDDILSQT